MSLLGSRKGRTSLNKGRDSLKYSIIKGRAYQKKFDMITATRILQIHIPRGEGFDEDKLIWTKAPSGKFSAKLIYKMFFFFLTQQVLLQTWMML